MEKVYSILEHLIKIIFILVLIVLLSLSTIYIAQIINSWEEVKISFVSIKMHLFTLLIVLIFLIMAFINRRMKLITFENKRIMMICLVIYAIICYKWINYSGVEPLADSQLVYDLAKGLIINGMDFINNNTYLARCPQQITMTLSFSVVMKLFSTTDFLIIQLLNIVSNIFIIIGIYKITTYFISKNRVDSLLSFFITLTLFPLIILSNFVYGDYIGLALVIWSIIYMLKYIKLGRKLYCVISAILIASSLFLKMNYLVIVIAYIIYFIIKIISNFEKSKNCLSQVMMFCLFCLIAMAPYLIVKNYITQKYDLNTKLTIPVSSYIYMGMSESYREAGWYGQTIDSAYINAQKAAKENPEKIKKRVKYFIKHPIYFLDFYKRKIVSGWSDPTFQSIWYGIKTENKDIHLQNIYNSSKYQLYVIYSRSLLLIIYAFSLFEVIINWKNKSPEKNLIYIIFLGGFFFHFLWEMKSRYVLPYLILLIPVATIGLSKFLTIIDKYLIKRKEVM